MPKLLELFSGTGSVGSIARGLGWEVTSLDINNKSNADVKTDILQWDYQNHPEQHYDFIWASPPCTEYSVAKTVGTRNLELADAIVRKTWEIISHFDPIWYGIENPQTGLLNSRPMMVGKSYTDIDYCKYGMPYKKRTRLWNNIQHIWKPRPLCKRDCDSLREGTKRHLQIAQRGPYTKKDVKIQQRFKQAELYRVPGMLVHEILTSVYPINVQSHSAGLSTKLVTLEFANL